MIRDLAQFNATIRCLNIIGVCILVIYSTYIVYCICFVCCCFVFVFVYVLLCSLANPQDLHVNLHFCRCNYPAKINNNNNKVAIDTGVQVATCATKYAFISTDQMLLLCKFKITFFKVVLHVSLSQRDKERFISRDDARHIFRLDTFDRI